jgi:hypothetical protein
MNGMWGNGPNTGVNNNGMNFGWSLPSPPQNSTGSFMAVIVNGGEASVNAYPVAAGTTVILIDFNVKKFWIKSTDVNSMPQPVRTFNFDEVFSAVPVTAQATPDTSEFVTKSEIAEIRKMLEDLTAQLK